MIPCFPILFQRCHSVRKKGIWLNSSGAVFSQHAMDLMSIMWICMVMSCILVIFITWEDAENALPRKLGGYDSIPPNNSTRSTFCNHFCNPELAPARILKEDTSQKVPYFCYLPVFWHQIKLRRFLL